MDSTLFPEANTHFKAPDAFEESQVGTIPAYIGRADGGSCDGEPIVVVAWMPNTTELEALNSGQPVFLTIMGGSLPPTMLTTNFQQATHPA